MPGAMWSLRMCSAIRVSFSDSGISLRTKIRSKRLSMVTGRFMFWAMVWYGLYRPRVGFEAARMLALAFRVATMPPFAMETTCCSMAGWIAPLSSSRILSISSMQQTPMSARTRAPASRVKLPVPPSLTTAAVSPAAVEPLPVVSRPLGATLAANWRSWLFPVPGSPTSRTLMSPLIRTSGSSLETPLKRRYMIASFMWSRP